MKAEGTPDSRVAVERKNPGSDLIVLARNSPLNVNQVIAEGIRYSSEGVGNHLAFGLVSDSSLG